MPPAPDDPAARAAAEAILERHDLGQAEDNIRAAARDFLVAVDLADRAEIEVEAPAGDGGRCDLTTADVIFEFKRRIGAKPGLQPDPVYVDQLDRYLASARDNAFPQRVGILTDGRNWIARWPDMAGLRTDAQYAHELKSADGWLDLYRWLSDVSQALEARGIPADDDEVRRRLGPGPRFQQHLAELRALYDANRERETIRVKRELWRRLLSAALGVAVEEEPDLDGLFLRHTYLSVVVGLAVQSAFGIDILAKAASEPADLIEGRIFQDETGVRGVVESDFFGWPAEVGGERWLQGMARRVQHFDWRNAESDIARILYESVIPAEDRRRLGEYYTPLWLARAIVDEVVQQPLEQTVLDPACGSGTFIYAAVERFLAAAREADWSAAQTLDRLPTQIQGIDVHPVSVHLARATWTFAARSALERARDAGVPVETVAPIYLGDSLQLRTAGQDLFSRDRVRIEIGDDRHLDFPLSLVQQSDWFDQTMLEISEAIENRDDPLHALDNQGITEDVPERGMLEQTVATMEALHAEGRDHIWSYYTRNMVRPTMLSELKVGAIVGNPPWLTYNKTQAIVRSELERQSKSSYRIWTGGRYATHQDVAGLFFTRCVDLYLDVGGSIGMVMPQSALQTGQYREWRTGAWNRVAADLAWREPWDLERIEPNTFFPVPSCVIFAERLEEQAGEGRRKPRGLPASASQWLGPEGGPYRRENVALRDTSGGYASPYGERARQGATIVPRCLFFVEEEESDAGIAADVVRVRARRGAQDKEPWRSLDLAKIDNRPIEREYVWDVHLGETVAPYVLLDPLRAVLPMTPDAPMIARDEHGIHGVARDTLKRNMARRWREINRIWEDNKSPNNRLTLLGQIDYMRKLSAQRDQLADSRAGEPASRRAGEPLNSIRSLANIQRGRPADSDDALDGSSDHRIETLHDSLPVETRGAIPNDDHQLGDAGRRGSAADVQGPVRGTGRSQAPLENSDSRVRRGDTHASGLSTSRSTTRRRGKDDLGRDSSGPSSKREEYIGDDSSASAARMASRVANRKASGTDSHAIDSLNHPVVFYASSGRPTAAVGFGSSTVESTLYWIECTDWTEACYIAAVINSEFLNQHLKPLMPKGQFGARHVQKHLWRLPIPEFDSDESLHLEIAEAGADAAVGAESVWREIEAERRAAGKSVSVTIARREIRAWLAESAEGKRVEALVERLLSPP